MRNKLLISTAALLAGVAVASAQNMQGGGEQRGGAARTQRGPPEADRQRDGTQHTMSYDLAAAAAATGLNKATRGQWWVEPAELLRVAEVPARVHGRLVPDKIHPGMWRVVWPSGTLSDIVNETRAKDAAWYIAESRVSTGTLAA
jgi:hypothetical protein